ncbi:MAG: hypothetical protein WBP45_02655 [Daejeonella sp.]
MNKELIYKLLWATIEEYTGLWELHWEINSALKVVSALNKELAKKILLYFLETGLVKLYYDKWGGDQLQEISQQEAIEIINKDKFWVAPEINDLCVKVSSTEKGEKYYNEELIQDSI